MILSGSSQTVNRVVCQAFCPGLPLLWYWNSRTVRGLLQSNNICYQGLYRGRYDIDNKSTSGKCIPGNATDASNYTAKV